MRRSRIMRSLLSGRKRIFSSVQMVLLAVLASASSRVTFAQFTEHNEAQIGRIVQGFEKQRRERNLPKFDSPTVGRFPNPDVFVSTHDLAEFGTAFSSIADQAHIAIIAEAAPFVRQLSTTAVKPLVNTPNGLRMPLSVAIRMVASSYDYDTLQTDGCTILLFKKFTDPDDLPFVTFDEVVQDLKSSLRAVAAFNPTIVYPNASNSPLISLLAEIDAKFGSSELAKGVSLSQLSIDEQQTMIDNAESSYLSGAVDPIQRALSALHASTNPNAVFLAFNLLKLGIPTFGYKGHFGPTGKQAEVALSRGFQFTVTGKNVATTDDGLRFSVAWLSKSTGDRTLDALLKQRLPGHLPDNFKSLDSDNASYDGVGSATMTIAKIVTRASNRSELGKSFAADVTIGQKTVSVFGDRNITAASEVASVARLYGLALVQREDGATYVTTRTVRRAKNLDEVPFVIESCYPEPLRRCFVSRMKLAESALILKAKKEAQKQLKTYNPAILIAAHEHDGPIKAQQTIYESAARQLRALIEPKMEKSPGGRYPMDQMTEHERRLFSLVLVSDNLRQVDRFARAYPPRCLADTSRMYITGTLHGKTNNSQIYMGYKTNRGSVLPEVGADVATPSRYLRSPIERL